MEIKVKLSFTCALDDGLINPPQIIGTHRSKIWKIFLAEMETKPGAARLKEQMQGVVK